MLKNEKMIFGLLFCIATIFLMSCYEQSPQRSSNGDSHKEERTFYFEDGTKIIVPQRSVTDIYSPNDSKYTIILPLQSVVELPNGVMLDVPAKTIIVSINDILSSITIGETESVIKYPDGTTSAVPAGTLLDNTGEITE